MATDYVYTLIVAMVTVSPGWSSALDFKVLVAEVIGYFLPKYVDLHSFSMSNSMQAKKDNWAHLNRKVLNRLGLQLSQAVIRDISQCKPWVIEHVLHVLRPKIDHQLAKLRNGKRGLDEEFLRWPQSDRPEVSSQRSPRKPGAGKDFATLEEFYLRKGMKLFPKEPERVDTIKDSNNLTPRQKKSILKLTELVPKEELEIRTRILADKQNTIVNLHNKIERMEHLLHLKDIRINDLTQRLQSLEDHLTQAPPVSPRAPRESSRPLATHRGPPQKHIVPLGRPKPRTVAMA